jgi:hypothetical protein
MVPLISPSCEVQNRSIVWSETGNVIANVQVKLRHLLQQAVTKLTRAIGFPRIVTDGSETVLGQTSSPAAALKSDQDHKASSVPPVMSQDPNSQSSADPDDTRPSIHDQLGRFSDMNTSMDTLAEQMLTLVEIVSAQERDIKALKEQCRRLEEHDQAIAVAFSTFFHVLSAGRVAKLSEIAAILNNIIKIAEQEGRPAASIKFLQDLAHMLPEEQR